MYQSQSPEFDLGISIWYHNQNSQSTYHRGLESTLLFSEGGVYRNTMTDHHADASLLRGRFALCAGDESGPGSVSQNEIENGSSIE